MFFKKKVGPQGKAVGRKETAVAGLRAGRMLMGTEWLAPGSKPESHCFTSPTLLFYKGRRPIAL